MSGDLDRGEASELPAFTTGMDCVNTSQISSDFFARRGFFLSRNVVHSKIRKPEVDFRQPSDPLLSRPHAPGLQVR